VRAGTAAATVMKRVHVIAYARRKKRISVPTFYGVHVPEAGATIKLEINNG
jgi:hypothetical protein